MLKHSISMIGMLWVLLVVSACAPHIRLREATANIPKIGTEAAANSDLVYGENDYLLAFVEFDDQGAYWDRNQTTSLYARINNEVGNTDLLLLVFVHGWQNNAHSDNGNVKTFQKVLAQLQAVHQNQRKVVGVYIGWRGLSLKIPGIKLATFWDRKNTAEKVGHGAVTDVLRQLEALHEYRHQQGRDDHLVIIGHSFGGQIVYSALSQIFLDRFIEAQNKVEKENPRSFGDLVVLINPAFEAQLYNPLYQLDLTGEYEKQLPVMAILTSETDLATKMAFPAGRWFSTLFEKHSDKDQKWRNRYAIGHYDKFQTHRLNLATEAVEPFKADDEAIRLSNFVDHQLPDIRSAWINRTQTSLCDYKTRLGYAELHSLCPQQGGSMVPVNTPYLVVKVDKKIIDGHSDLGNPYLLDFIQRFVLFALPITHDEH